MNVVLRFGEMEGKLITRQLSQMDYIQAKHYEGIVGTTHTARAFRSMEALCRQAPETDQPSTWRRGATKRERSHWKREATERERGATQKEEQPKKHKHVNYTSEKEEKLCKYFATEITHGKLLTRFACEEFTRDHLWGRSKDQISHKVKNLVNSA